MTYKTAWFCVGCKGELSWNQMMHNHGTCPLCGTRERFTGTVVDTFTRSYRVERIHPWWKFWKFEKTRRVFKESESSV